MASVSSLGVGSGIDIQGLVSNLLQAEGAAKSARLDRKEAEYQAKLSLYSNVKSALSDFQSSFHELRLTSSFNSYDASSSDSKVFTATARNGADVASYDVEVNQLAQSQKLISAPFADKNATSIGTGTLVINFGTYTYDATGNITGFTADSEASEQEIEITDGTLEGIRDSINSANVGAKASIINDPASGYKLILTSDTGEQNALNITIKSTTDAFGVTTSTDSDGDGEDNSGLSQLAYDPTGAFSSAPINYMTESQKALSANATIDGVAITSETNSISDVIEKVTIELKSMSTETETLSVGRDTANIKEAVQTFVDGYNSLMDTLNSASFYDEDTGTAGILIGDATVRGIVSQIRNVLNTSVNNPQAEYNSFASIGILTTRDGKLEYDSSKLDAGLNSKPDEIKHILAGGRATANSGQFTIESITDNIPAGTYSVSVDGTRGIYTGASYFDASTGLDFSAGVDLKVEVDGFTSGVISLTTDYYQGGARTANQALADFKADLLDKINADATLKAEGLSVSVDLEQHATDGTYRLLLLSNQFGDGSTVKIVQDAAQVGLTTLGSTVDGAGSNELLIGGQPATFKDGILTGSGLYAGFELKVGNSFVGDLFSTIQVSQGSISALNDMINSFLDSDGLLDSKKSGMNASIADIEAQRAALAERLEKVEARYIKQFSAMDSLVAQLNSTSSFLENQLSNLPATSKK